MATLRLQSFALSVAFAAGLLSFPLCATAAGSARVIETRIPVLWRVGVIAWLDSDTLAITTHKTTPFQWWYGKIMAFDVRREAATTLDDAAFLNCTSARTNLVAVTKGSHELTFLGPGPGRTAPEKVFFRWDASSKSLVAEEKEGDSRSNWNICRQTAPADRRQVDLALVQNGVRYLEPGDGVLRGDRSGKVVLEKPDGQRRVIAATMPEILPVPKYAPFLKRYLLHGGRFRLKAQIVLSSGEKTAEIPIATMDSDGEVDRSFLGEEIKAQLAALGQTDGQAFPVAGGTLIYVGGFADRNGGLYMAAGKSLTRVWCDSPRMDCGIDSTHFTISPDGCKVAFAQLSWPEVRVVDVCRQ